MSTSEEYSRPLPRFEVDTEVSYFVPQSLVEQAIENPTDNAINLIEYGVYFHDRLDVWLNRSGLPKSASFRGIVCENSQSDTYGVTMFVTFPGMLAKMLAKINHHEPQAVVNLLTYNVSDSQPT